MLWFRISRFRGSARRGGCRRHSGVNRGQREHKGSSRGLPPKGCGAVFSGLLSLAVLALCAISPLNYPPYILTSIIIIITIMITAY